MASGGESDSETDCESFIRKPAPAQSTAQATRTKVVATRTQPAAAAGAVAPPTSVAQGVWSVPLDILAPWLTDIPLSDLLAWIHLVEDPVSVQSVLREVLPRICVEFEYDSKECCLRQDDELDPVLWPLCQHVRVTRWLWRGPAKRSKNASSGLENPAELVRAIDTEFPQLQSLTLSMRIGRRHRHVDLRSLERVRALTIEFCSMDENDWTVSLPPALHTLVMPLSQYAHRLQTPVPSQLDRLEMIYRVPWYVPGCPLYIVQVCMVFLIIKLRRYGYTVRPIAEDKLYVTWARGA